VSRSFFVGSLFAIPMFLFAYNGSSTAETIASRAPAVAALGVALAPCGCGSRIMATRTIAPFVHFTSAAAMFLVLTFFCYRFWLGARRQRYAQARLRGHIYALCGIAIALTILVLIVDNLTAHSIGQNHPRLTFYMEQTALAAFGISWLVAAKSCPSLPAETNVRLLWRSVR
jgi:hypothetical protein